MIADLKQSDADGQRAWPPKGTAESAGAWNPGELGTASTRPAVLRAVDDTLQPTSAKSLLAKYSLRGHLDEVERLLVDQRPLLGSIVAEGQATCFFAAPSTGKTLITMHLITDAIANGRLNPERLLYVNMDDNSNGLLEKCRVADEYGFHMLADGYLNFSLKQFRHAIEEMVSHKTVNGSILVLDTLKKFVDTMNKSEARKFTGIVRQFVAQGGTVLALAHTNKNTDAAGNYVYSGTSDVLDDFDCAYIVSKVRKQDSGPEAVAVFQNKKSRGTVVDKAAYSYATGPMTYSELLASVQSVDAEKWAPLCAVEDELPDTTLIDAVQDAISRGVTSKMLLAADVSQRMNVSRQKAIRIIERYAQPGQPGQRWTFARGDRGRHQYSLIVAEVTQPA